MAKRDVMSMDISDLEDLQKDMEQAVRKIPGIAEKRMGKATLIVERQAEINATSYPKVRTGRLRADITPEVTSIKGEVTGIVGNEVIYAPYQELGTRYIEPRRYLERALEDKEDEVYAELDGVLEEVETMIEHGGGVWP